METWLVTGAILSGWFLPTCITNDLHSTAWSQIACHSNLIASRLLDTWCFSQNIRWHNVAIHHLATFRLFRLNDLLSTYSITHFSVAGLLNQSRNWFEINHLQEMHHNVRSSQIYYHCDGIKVILIGCEPLSDSVITHQKAFESQSAVSIRAQFTGQVTTTTARSHRSGKFPTSCSGFLEIWKHTGCDLIEERPYSNHHWWRLW